MNLRVLTGVLIVVGVLVLGAMVWVLLDDGDSERIVTVGQTSVSIPADTPTDEILVAMWRDYLPQTGFYPSYQQCLLAEMEARETTATEIEELAELSDEARLRRGLELSREFEARCKGKDGEDVFDPGASVDQIDMVREALAKGLRAELADELSSTELDCFERQINALPSSQIVAVMNGTETEIEAMFFQVGKRCA